MGAILITRPAEKAERTAEALQALGHDAMIAPVLDVQRLSFDTPDVDAYSEILFTSGHGVAYFAAALDAKSAHYKLPVFCVGDKTAYVAQQVGFKDVRSAGGDVGALVDLVAQAGAVEKPYLHVRGTHVSDPLHVLLGAKGIAVEILRVYETSFADAFSPDIVRAIKGGDVSAVMLYSARSAQAFAQLVEHHDLVGALAGIKLLSISKAVLGYVQSYQWRAVAVAERPDQASLFALI